VGEGGYEKDKAGGQMERVRGPGDKNSQFFWYNRSDRELRCRGKVNRTYGGAFATEQTK